MKRIGYILLILMLALAVALTGCGGSESASDADAQDSANTEQGEQADAADAGNGMEGMGDLLSAAYVDLMKSDEYTMSYKATMDFEGQPTEITATVAVKGDDTAMTSSGQGFESTVIMKDDKVYMVDHASKTVTSWTQSQVDMGAMETGTVDTENITFIGSGKEDGLVYEEYSVADGTVKYYFDGKDLVRISTMIEGMETVMDIVEMSDKVPADMFEIPAGYQKIEM